MHSPAAGRPTTVLKFVLACVLCLGVIVGAVLLARRVLG